MWPVSFVHVTYSSPTETHIKDSEKKLMSAISATTPPPELKIFEVMLGETMALSIINAVSVTMLLIEKTPCITKLIKNAVRLG